MITKTANKTCVVCLKTWDIKYLYVFSTRPKENQILGKKDCVVKAAAKIICEAQVYKTTQYTPSNNFLRDINSVIPESVRLLFKTIILKNK